MEEQQVLAEYFAGDSIGIQTGIRSDDELVGVHIDFTLIEKERTLDRTVQEALTKKELKTNFQLAMRLPDDLREGQSQEDFTIIGEVPEDLTYGLYSYDRVQLNFSDGTVSRLEGVPNKGSIRVTARPPKRYEALRFDFFQP